MQELVKIAENRSKISPETIAILRNAPILLGSPYKSYAFRHKYLDSDETISFATNLLRPTQVFAGRNCYLVRLKRITGRGHR
jgi:hypothetical protein